MNNNVTGISDDNFFKGIDYLNKITILLNQNKFFIAKVAGSAPAPYIVKLDKSIEYKEIGGTCTCPAFMRYDECKHVAAVILTKKLPFFKDVNSRYDFIGQSGFLYDDEYDHYIDYNYEENKKRPILFDQYLRQYQHSQPTHDRLKSFYETTARPSSVPACIWYTIEFYTTYDDKVKVEFSLRCQTLLKSGKMGKVKNVQLDTTIISQLPNKVDRDILTNLLPYAEWEYSYSLRKNAFSRGSFELNDNRKVFIDILKTNRALQEFRYGRNNENLFFSDEILAKQTLNVNSLKREIIPEIIVGEKHLPADEVLMLDNFIFLKKNNTFYLKNDQECLKQDTLNLVNGLKEHSVVINETQWEVLRKYLMANVEHNVFTGDRFLLETVLKEQKVSLYLKWDNGPSHFVQGLVYLQKDDLQEDALLQYNMAKMNKLLAFFEDENIEFSQTSSIFQLPVDDVYKICEFAKVHSIDVFLKDQKIHVPREFNLTAKSGINWLELEASIDFDDSSLDYKSILKRLDLSNNSIKFNDNSIGLLPEKWVEKIKKLQQHTQQITGKTLLHPAKILALEDFEEIFKSPEIANLKTELQHFKSISLVEESRHFKGKLRPYQRLALGWFEFLERCHFGGCLADDMGLGKTVQIIAHLQRKFHQKKNLKILIVCPKSLTGNWQDEFSKFAPEVKTIIWEKGKLQQQVYDSVQVILVSYPLLQRQHSFDFEFDHLILDEAQAIKNPQSLTHNAVALVAAKNKLALTGTPVENHAGDLMSLYNILIPGLFENKKIKDPSSIDNFNFLQPFILRRSKEEVLSDIPSKTVQTIYCDQSKKEAHAYLQYHHSFKKELDSQNSVGNKFNLLQVLTKLRQAACHFDLIDNTNEVSSSKIETLKELVNDIHQSGQKVIIFSQFTRLLKIVKIELGLSTNNCAYLDGQSRNRDEIINTFKQDDDVKTFLISVKAGGVGLNLTNASYCIILDPWWNPAVEAQAIDRIHRIGQKNPVFAYRLITKGTIEEKVSQLQESKKELYAKILQNNEGFIKELKKTDIEFLLS